MKKYDGKKYELILADPPWVFNDKNSGGSYKSGSANHYDVMGAKSLCDLPIKHITADNCLLALWWVGSQPVEALRIVNSWGFSLKTMTGFTWWKQTKSGTDAFGMGHLTRQSTENCLFALKGKNKRVNASVRNFIGSERLKHSEKPAEARDRLVQLLGDVPRVELFAREKSPGWDTVGLDLDGTDIKQLFGGI